MTNAQLAALMAVARKDAYYILWYLRRLTETESRRLTETESVDWEPYYSTDEALHDAFDVIERANRIERERLRVGK